MKKKFFRICATLTVAVIIAFNVILTFNQDQQFNMSLLKIGQIAKAEAEAGSVTVPCYWTYQTGWFASWNIMTCYSCIPEKVKNFRDRGSCSL